MIEIARVMHVKWRCLLRIVSSLETYKDSLIILLNLLDFK